MDITKFVKDAASECNIKPNNDVNYNEIIKLISVSLEKIINSSDFIDYIDEELGFKLR